MAAVSTGFPHGLSPMAGTDLDAVLRNLGTTTVIVAGVSVNIAVTNRGGTPHLTAEWLRLATGTEMTAAHYRGAPQAMPDIVSGRVQATVDSVPGLKAAVGAGSLKLLAVCSPSSSDSASTMSSGSFCASFQRRATSSPG